MNIKRNKKDNSKCKFTKTPMFAKLETMLLAQNKHELAWQNMIEPKQVHINGFSICQKVLF